MAEPKHLLLVDRLRGHYHLPVNDGAGPLNGSMTFSRKMPTTPIALEAADEIDRLTKALAEADAELAGGWLPIILCPTDSVYRLVKLPDGREVSAAFDGEGLIARRRWRTKTLAYHNPSKPSGEVIGGIERMTTPYDTHLIADLPTGVYPTHFRPNDTVLGTPTYIIAAARTRAKGTGT